MAMTILRNRSAIFPALLLGILVACNVNAAVDSPKEGGIGGTGAPAMHGGIGGTGVQPNGETDKQTIAGKVLFIVGEVEANNLGKNRKLSKGDPVRAGDTLISGKNAALQLRMEDGGTIVLRPESQLLIESYAYKGTQDGSEHIALELLTGGFRAITGNIGKLHKDNYVIRTPNATVGIRGTDHETVFVPMTLPGQAAVVEPGTYNHVISGATVLQSNQRKLLIEPNQTGFAALNGTSPIILDKPLPIFGDTHSRSDGQGEHYDDFNHNSDGHHSGSGPGESKSDSEQHLTQTYFLGNSSVDLNNFETDSTPADPGSAVVGAHMSQKSVGSAQVDTAGEKLLIEYNSPSAYSNDATGFNYIDHNATLINYDTAVVDGVDVNWGIYAGGIAFDAAGNAAAINFHSFAYTEGGVTPPSVMSSLMGSFTFSPVGSTSVTESGNRSNSGVTLNVAIDFATAKITNYTLGVTDANTRYWTGTLSSPATLSTFANGIPLNVNCPSCSGMATGSAAGIVIGQTAKGLISSYQLSTTTGQAVTGAVVLSRP